MLLVYLKIIAILITTQWLKQFHQEITMAILTIDGQAASVEKILITHQEKSLPEKKGKEK